MAAVADLAADLAGWQALLDRHADAFAELVPGAAVGLLADDDAENPGAPMIVWESTTQGMQATQRPFPGFEGLALDLLFIGDRGTLARLADPATPEPLRLMREQARRRDMLLYVVRPRDALSERGFDDFLDRLGLVVMGACR